VRQPLPSVLVDAGHEKVISGMEPLVMEELNIKEVRYENDLGGYMDYSVKPDFKKAGPALGPRMKEFAASVARADAGALLAALEEAGGSVAWSISEASVVGAASDDTIMIERDFIDVRISAREGYAVATEGGVFAILDTTLTPELVREGLMREFVSKIQQLRKQTGLEMMDNIEIRYDGDDEIADAVEAYRGYIMKETLATTLKRFASSYENDYDLNGHKTGIDIAKV
jgi:isoleucyl-tRNA synthetase